MIYVQCFGDLQGKSSSSAGFRLVVSADETVEPAEVFAARVVGWWKKAIMQRTLALPPREGAHNVLVTSHGGFIGTLVRTLIGSGKARCAPGVVIATVPNSSVTIIEVERDGLGTIVQFGDVGHLTQKLEEEMMETNVDEAVVDNGK